MTAVLDFALSPAREAAAPPEQRGLARDEVRLLVARPEDTVHTRFRDLPAHLGPGDVVVVNTSATLPAALDGSRRCGPVAVHVSGQDDDGAWLVELRPPVAATGPVHDARPGEVVHLPGSVPLRLVEPYPDPDTARDRTRLWRARARLETGLTPYLRRWGRPITYGYLRSRPGLADYQTVFADEPGSAEMPSAGRPFTSELVTRLVVRGVALVPVLLHTGVSSAERGEPPLPEPYVVPTATAAVVNALRAAGGRVVAVGTTATRALETVARPDGTVRPGRGRTDLVLGPARPARTVTGLVTGWHAPGASHLALLEAVAGEALVRRAYAEALAGDYLWHEFGDTALLLPALAGSEQVVRR